MSGPIVRTGTNPKFWSNWDNVFGNKKKGSAKSAEKPAEKKAAEPAAAKKSAKKAAPKKTAKKKGK